MDGRMEGMDTNWSMPDHPVEWMEGTEGTEGWMDMEWKEWSLYRRSFTIGT